MKKIIITIVLLVVVLSVYFLIKGIKKEEAQYDDTKFPEVIIDSPKAGSLIQSPLMIRGKAKGSWFFEAVFPIVLKNKEGKEIVSSRAQAQGEWMTDGYVPFSAELLYPVQNKGESGVLIFKRDNPSGLPENDASVSIPVIF